MARRGGRRWDSPDDDELAGQALGAASLHWQRGSCNGFGCHLFGVEVVGEEEEAAGECLASVEGGTLLQCQAEHFHPGGKCPLDHKC